MSSLGYKLLDYNVLSTLKISVMVQEEQRHPRIRVLVMSNVQRDNVKTRKTYTENNIILGYRS